MSTMSLQQLSAADNEILPAYYRLQQAIIEKLANGQWQPGKQLPSEREFARTTGLSIGTVRKALENLVRQGYLVRIQGKGTYVTMSDIKRAVRYYRMRRSIGERNVALEAELVAIREIPHQSWMAESFGLTDASASFVCIERLLSGSDDTTSCPVALSLSYIPLPFGRLLMGAKADEIENLSIYLLIEKYTSLPVLNSSELISIENADMDSAGKLQMPTGSPVIKSLMISTSYNSTAVEYRKSLIRTNPFGLLRLHNLR